MFELAAMEAKATSPNYRKFVACHGIHVAELDAAPVALLQGKLRDAIEMCQCAIYSELRRDKEGGYQKAGYR